MKQLLWKEWHEQSWKLAFGCLVLSAMAWIGLRSRITADEIMMMWVSFVGLMLLPVLSSTGLLPAERSEGSFESLLALPVTPWRILTAKTVMGLVLCAGPMVVALIVSLIAVGGRELPESAAVDLFVRATLATLSLFVWMTALTARLPSEARAGLVAMGVLVFWMLATAGLTAPELPQLFSAVSPLAFVYGFATDFVGAPPWGWVLFVQAIIAAALWIWTARMISGPAEGAK